MKKDSRIYIAGHKGLVGSTILRELKNRGYRNLIYRESKALDLRSQGQTEIFFKQEKPEYVFMAAGKVGGILANSTHKAEFIYDNIMMTANIIHSAYKYGVKKLINLGSACAYPRLSAQPIKEEYLLSGNLEPTNEPYAIAKICGIKFCQYYNEQYDTNFISVMPTNLYGPNDNFDLDYSHLLPALIRKFYLAKLLQESEFEAIKKDFKVFGITGITKADLKQLKPKETIRILASYGITPVTLTLWGTGKPYREYLYIDDLAEACIFIMQKYNTAQIGELINIGTGKDLQIKVIADLVKNIVGFKGKVLWDSSRPDGMPRRRLDISKLHKLGWKAKVNLEKGIKKVYEWYKNLSYNSHP